MKQRLKNILKMENLLLFIPIIMVFIVMFYLMLRVPIQWDDWGRFHITSSFERYVQVAKDYYQTGGGRIFGTFLSVFFLKNKLIWAIFGAGLFSALTWLTVSLFKNRNKLGYMLAAFLIIMTPLPLLSETYTWICGFGYYAIPLLSFLLYIFFEKSTFLDVPRKTTVLRTLTALFLGLFTQLFIENIAIMAMGAGLGILLFSFFTHKKVNGSQIAFSFSTILGGVIMFLSPAYKTLGQTSEWVNLSIWGKVSAQIPDILYYMVPMCAIPITIILVSLIYKMWSSKINIIEKVLLSIIMIVEICLSYKRYFLSDNADILVFEKAVYIILLLAIPYAIKRVVTDKKDRNFLIFLYIIGVFSAAPLVMSSYFGARNFICWYFILIIIAIRMLHDVIVNKKIIYPVAACIFLITALWGAKLVLVYRAAARTEDSIIKIVKEYKENPTGVIYIPRIHDSKYFHGVNPPENPEKYHNIAFKKYYELDQDVQIILTD